MKIASLRSIVLVALIALGTAAMAHAQWMNTASNASIPADKLIKPEALNLLLNDAKAAKPVVLQVGSRVLFAQAHIVGSEYVGPGATPEGIAALVARVNKLPRTTHIVLYCGCCPWDRCPNLGPAYAKLRELGFIQAQVLYVANNLGADWVAKGYKVAQGQ